MLKFLLDATAGTPGTEAPTTTTPTTTGGFDIFGTIMIVAIIGIVIVMFWLSSRRNKKQKEEYQKMYESLAIGDEVITNGGIIGQIVSMKGETVTIATSKARTKMRILKTAIYSIEVKANEEKKTEETAEGGAQVTASPDLGSPEGK